MNGKTKMSLTLFSLLLVIMSLYITQIVLANPETSTVTLTIAASNTYNGGDANGGLVGDSNCEYTIDTISAPTGTINQINCSVYVSSFNTKKSPEETIKCLECSDPSCTAYNQIGTTILATSVGWKNFPNEVPSYCDTSGETCYFAIEVCELGHAQDEVVLSDAWAGFDFTPDITKPTFEYNNSNTSSIFTGEPILIYANWSDDNNLEYAWLSTNETGVWFNYTDGTYGSPTDINLTPGETWSNFTWDNDTFISGVVAWKIYANDSAENENVTGETTFTVNPGWLEVNLSLPPNPYNIVQNDTFIINATVYCRGGNCGNVDGTARYNLSSTNPDTPINTTQGDKPFFVNETPALAMKSCPTNPLTTDEFCNITWIVNATGDINTDWKIGVLFNSSYMGIWENHTDNVTVSINSCGLDLTVQWFSIKFGLLNPSTGPWAAPDNSNDEYNITVNSGSCNLDLYINGTDLTNTTYNSQIGVDNITWSNTSDVAGEFNLSHTVDVIKINVPENTNATTWYWINVPAVYAGYYDGIIFIYGVENGESPP